MFVFLKMNYFLINIIYLGTKGLLCIHCEVDWERDSFCALMYDRLSRLPSRGYKHAVRSYCLLRLHYTR